MDRHDIIVGIGPWVHSHMKITLFVIAVCAILAALTSDGDEW